MHSTEASELPAEWRRQLIEIARASIAYGLDHRQPLPVQIDEFPARLGEEQGCFVTLMSGGELRGCIGNLEANRPLVDAVAANAYSAAFADPRFRPLSREELPLLKIHLSLLSPSVEVLFGSESELLAQLRPSVDGLIIEQDARRATFLPSVWEPLPAPKEFLRHLKHKAGIPEHCDPRSLKAWRYTVESISD